MLKLKQAFEDLHDRMQKQIAEKIWEIERVKGLKEGTDEWYDFAGAGAIKERVLAKLKKELKERKKNLKVLKEIMKCRK